MKSLRSHMLAVLLLAAAAAPAFAVDTVQSRDAPDLAAVRAKIKARDFKSAIADLNALIDSGAQHADVYNLLGYSLRRSGDPKTALTFYLKALDFDPDHKGALEYLGELYVEIGNIAKARENAARLTKLCPQGCEELKDLQQAIAAASAKAN
ncbi:MAG: tetratricopeptide repeat protein [Xanthobacteraceae bacterium]